jgi:replicative DNA helicase
VAQKFVFADEVLALLLTDDAAAKRLGLVLGDYEFPKPEQTDLAKALLSFTEQWGTAAKHHANTYCGKEHHGYIAQLRELAKDVHTEYVLGRLNEFLREGAARKTVAKALDHMQMGEWPEIEDLFRNHSHKSNALFDPGVRLRGDDLKALLAEDPDEQVYQLNIAPLDQAHIGPAPKTLFLFIAPPKRGKSWFLVHAANAALRQRKTVVHVTLEMNKKQVARRYLQNALSLTKRAVPDISTTRFQFDAQGRLSGFVEDKVQRPALGPDLFDKCNNLFSRYKLYVKEFPTRSIDAKDLRAYLDSLEQIEGIVPDVLVIDYVDLMKVDAANLRVDTGVIYQEVRGIGMERGIAVVTASQGNRASANARWVRDDMVAEDWSKIMTADMVLTYSQTPEERTLNLARLFVSNGRDEGDKWAMAISQAYPMGQFALDAVRLPEDTYFRMIEEANGTNKQEGDE